MHCSICKTKEAIEGIGVCPDCAKPGRIVMATLKPKRPTREQLHMQTALMWSRRSIDPRLQVGCVITSADMRRILSIGYNGPAKGLPHDYARATPGDSGCIHAEMNAIAMMLAKEQGAKMFVTHQPCEICAQLIVQASIAEVMYLYPYRCDKGLKVFEMCGIKATQMELE